MSEDRIEGYRNFINKLWNSARFLLMNLDGYSSGDLTPTGVEDRWILSRLQRTIGIVRESLDEYRFNDAAGAVYQFLWHEFCDWYIEISKPALSGKFGEEERAVKQRVLVHVMEQILKLAHPVIPFVTEEIWHSLPGERDSIVLTPFPEEDPARLDEEAEEKMRFLIALIRGIRHLRQEVNIPPGAFVQVRLRGGDQDFVREKEEYVKRLARVESIDYLSPEQVVKGEATSVVENADIFIPVKGLLDFDAERKRIRKEMEKVEKEIEGLARRLENENFLTRAPAELVEKTKERKGELEEKLARLRTVLELFEE
ncbi:MAG: hypothetical protein D6713_03045 [Deltaproteobacteria bacterium]|nr:MAG: hypothetical protein D6713_03045 [Deltaproteobacteria bacterium]